LNIQRSVECFTKLSDVLVEISRERNLFVFLDLSSFNKVKNKEEFMHVVSLMDAYSSHRMLISISSGAFHMKDDSIETNQ